MSWRRFFRREHTDAEQQQELESYIDITAEEYVAQGMSPTEARLAARRKLGNLTRIREEVYEMNTATLVDGLFREVRHALRMLRLNPAFSITAVVTLALGVGATTAMFSVVNAVLIKPLAYPDSESVVTVTHSAVFAGERGDNFPFSPQMLAVYQSNAQAFEHLGLWRTGQATVTGQGDPEPVTALLMSEGFLPTLRVAPDLGRWFTRSDDDPGGPETVILSNGYWQRHYGGERNVLGQTILIDSRPRTIIGVMPSRFFATNSPVDVLLPLRIDMSQPPSDFSYRAIGRTKHGVSIAQANADIGRMLPAYLERFAKGRMDALHLRPAVRELKVDVVGKVGEVLWILLGSISILLLIACANVANLLLVRAEGRGQELAVRTALGAGWGHIARGLMVESLTLSVFGGAIGLAVASAGVRALVAYGPATLPRLDEISIDPMVLAFAITASVLSGLVFGLAPVLKIFGAKLELRGGGRWASGGRSQHRSQNVLVVVEVALALVLLVGSGLMIRTFQNMRGVKPGFTDPATLQTVRITMPDAMAREPERVVRMQSDLRAQLAAIPAIQSAGYIDNLPTEGPNQVIVFPADKTYGPGELPHTRPIKFVSPGLLRTMGTPIVAGRDLAWDEIHNQRNVALVSESFAKETWNTIQGALGKRIRVGTTGPWQEVVGVVADVYDDGADHPAPASVYWPSRQHPMIVGTITPLSLAFVLRTDRTGTEGLLRDIRQAVSTVAPELPLVRTVSMAEVYDASMARTTFSLVLLGIAGAMALVLGIVGIYGVLAYAVSLREREVGIRLALGAQRQSVTRMFVKRGLVLSGLGIVLGAAAAAAVTRLMASLLFGVKPVDTLTFAMSAGVLILAALAASYLPARRAATVDPLVTLRGQ